MFQKSSNQKTWVFFSQPPNVFSFFSVVQRWHASWVVLKSTCLLATCHASMQKAAFHGKNAFHTILQYGKNAYHKISKKGKMPIKHFHIRKKAHHTIP